MNESEIKAQQGEQSVLQVFQILIKFLFFAVLAWMIINQFGYLDKIVDSYANNLSHNIVRSGLLGILAITMLIYPLVKDRNIIRQINQIRVSRGILVVMIVVAWFVHGFSISKIDVGLAGFSASLFAPITMCIFGLLLWSASKIFNNTIVFLSSYIVGITYFMGLANFYSPEMHSLATFYFLVLILYILTLLLVLARKIRNSELALIAFILSGIFFAIDDRSVGFVLIAMLVFYFLNQQSQQNKISTKEFLFMGACLILGMIFCLLIQQTSWIKFFP